MTTYNYWGADWDKFNKVLKYKLQDTIHSAELKSKPDFHHNVWALTEAILGMADEVVLKTKPLPYMKRWWSLELSKLQAKTRQWGQKAYANRHVLNHKSHAKYHAA